ncbi:MAG: hypothetical protein A2Z05_07640 [Chloroflexi bacterium RBG_16_60_22]|nr:MAG: hypothetical protein A2Z05_07640 [Chloroflexi bacterium RBG_16_60_22]
MTFLGKLSLGKKISLLLVLGLVLGISVFSFLGMRAVNQATEVMLEDRLTTAHLVAGYLDETLERALTELGSAARSIGGDGSPAAIAAAAQNLAATYSRLSIEINNVYVVDAGGRVSWSQTGLPALSGRNFTFYPGVSRVTESGTAYISGLVSEPITRTPVVLLTSPVKDRAAGASGMLVIAVDVGRSSIGGFIRPIQLGQTGYVEIVDQNGIVVARTEPGPTLSPFEKSDHSGRFADLIAAGQPTRGLCHTCHEPVQRVERDDVLAFVPLSQASWGVIIRQSEAEALAPVYELRQSLILVGALLTAMATFIVIITTRDVINRLKFLTVASRRIAAGDLDSSVTASEEDEVGMLARAFEDMRSRLKTYTGELEKRTRELSHLLSVSEMLSHLPELTDLDAALGSVLDKTLAIMNEKVGAILLLDEERQVLYCQVNHGLYRKNSSHLTYKLDGGISSQAVRTGEVITTGDISRDSRFSSSTPKMTEGLQAFISVPLRSKEKILGVLNIASHDRRQFSPEDVKLLEGIARQITAATENARLHREVQQKEEIRGELLEDMFSIQEEERKRIARELHDETSQVIASLTASLEAATAMLPGDAEKPRAMLKKAQGLSINILDDVHKLIYDLRPSLLDDLGLEAAARWLTEVNLEAAGINVTFKTTGRQRRLAPGIEVTLFRVIQEAVNNIARHSRARNTSLSLQYRRNAIRVQVKDDGQGFDVEEAISSRERPRGLGLVGMKERVAIAGGTLDIRSDPVKGGTEIIIEIPLNKEVANAQDKSAHRG